MSSKRILQHLFYTTRRSFSSSSFRSCRRLFFLPLQTKPQFLQNPCSFSFPRSLDFHFQPSSIISLRSFNTNSSQGIRDDQNKEAEPHLQYETDEGGETTDGWEEEEDVEPEVNDGGDGGGVVLQDVPWGERALSIAQDILQQFGDDFKLYAFKTTPRGYIYVRVDKLSTKYGCPSMEELESYSEEYKKRLDEAGARGDIPDDLALEVSSPGAERILKIPDDLDRFIQMPMRVRYVEDLESKCTEKDGIFMLEAIETESEICVWKLANTKENRDPMSKGRPMSRKQKDWRLKLPFLMHRRVILYLEY